MKILRPTLLLALAAASVPSAPLSAQANVTLPAADRALPGRLEPAFELAGPGASGEPFGSVGGLAFDAAENLYVLDRARQRVTVFDRAGRRLREFGEGRLGIPMSLALADDGSVLVADLQREGVVVFSPEGEYRSTVTFPAGFSPNVAVQGYPGGGMVATLRPAAAARAPRGAPVRTATALSVVPLEGTAEPRELMVVRESTQADESTSTSAAPGGGGQQLTTRIRPALAPALHWGVLPEGGLAVVNTEAYRVQVAGPQGRVERVIRREIAPRRVSDADREAFNRARRGSGGPARVVTSSSSGGSIQIPTGAVQAQFEELEFAERVSVVQRLSVDRKGRLWIERAGEVWGQPGPVDVVGADGAYLGTLRGEPMPRAFSRGGLTAAVRADPAGGAHVVVRRLPAAMR